jgi:hypothetical protein
METVSNKNVCWYAALGKPLSKDFLTILLAPSQLQTYPNVSINFLSRASSVLMITTTLSPLSYEK